ncbi:MAG: hypothetical protein MUD01_27505, partial [Chloroflexaceae bacterium]|nr:hypothetical protein [Chloroflexaceae bacterium]
MPDWSYQTLFRPLLFRLPAQQARSLTLRALGLLGAHELGPRIIALMGHTQPPASLARTVAGVPLATPVGIGADLPGNDVALAAFARFGVGLVELGPVAQQDWAAAAPPERQAAAGSIVLYGDSLLAAETLVQRLAACTVPPTQVAVRLGHMPGASAEAAAAERVLLLGQLAPWARLFTLTPPPPDWSLAGWQTHVASLVQAAAAWQRPLLVGVAADDGPARMEQVVRVALEAGAAGVLICGGAAGAAGSRLLGRPAYTATLNAVRRLRATWPTTALVAAGATHEPADGLALLAAGADVLQLDAGLVLSGPGLPKRINEALRFQLETPQQPMQPRTWRSWPGTSWL